jgi:hypothetical protein
MCCGNRALPAARAAYTLYLKESLRSKRYDQLVRELVSAKGRPWDTGAIGYYMRDNKMPLDNFASTARIFLGTRIQCAQCQSPTQFISPALSAG